MDDGWSSFRGWEPFSQQHRKHRHFFCCFLKIDLNTFKHVKARTFWFSQRWTFLAGHLILITPPIYQNYFHSGSQSWQQCTHIIVYYIFLSDLKTVDRIGSSEGTSSSDQEGCSCAAAVDRVDSGDGWWRRNLGTVCRRRNFRRSVATSSEHDDIFKYVRVE